MKKLSRLYHKNGTDNGDMHYIVQPRGAGKSFVFRMLTPEALKGGLNPRTGRQFGKEIKLGLNTRHLPTARQRRDVILGELRQLQLGENDQQPFSLQDSMVWREDVATARQNDPSGKESEGIELILMDKLEAEENRGRPLKPLQRFARVAQGKGFPISHAHTQYVHERSPDNAFGFKPLKLATQKELGIALRHLGTFLGDVDGTSCMEDVTPDVARRFRQDYLPSVKSKQTKAPMAARTADKYVTMLRPMWDWAVSDRKLVAAKYRKNPWIFDKTVPRSKRTDTAQREAFSPVEMSSLLEATKRGTRGGDALRLSIATGVRINELLLLTTADIEPDGTGFNIREGKTENATRFIPLVGDAQHVLRARITGLAAPHGRVFPEWPIKPSTGRCGAVTRWFIDLRRKVLGAESNNRLTLHSTRHTWRTVARRAGVADRDVNDLGGWAGERTSSSTYDHGLTKENLRDRQAMVWDELETSGYLKGF